MSRKGPGCVVETATVTHAELLGHRNLHVVDVIAVPDRLEQAVGEAQHQDVLDRFLSKIMIDAVDLMLVKNLEELAIELLCGSEIGAEWLLDDHTAPAAVALAGEPGFPEPPGDRLEGRRRRGQVEQAITGAIAFLFDARKFLTQSVIGFGVLGSAFEVGNAAEQLPHNRRIAVARPKLVQRLFQTVAENFCRELRAPYPDDRKRVRQQPPGGEIVQRGHEQSVGQIS